MAANSAKFAATVEQNEAQTVLAIENALNVTLPGATAEDKGYGVQHIRDMNGKIVEVIVFFDDKVPQGERAAALEKIQRNNGVATVDLARRVSVEGFESYNVGLVPYDGAGQSWEYETHRGGLSFPDSGIHARSEVRIAFPPSGPTGSGTAAINVDNAKAASGLQSLECVADGLTGTYAGIFSRIRAQVGEGANLINKWPQPSAPVSLMTTEISVCSPLANGAVAAHAQHSLGFNHQHQGNDYFNGLFGAITNMRWQALTDPTTPPAAISWTADPGYGAAWVVLSGSAGDLDIPMDGAFHKIKTTLVSQTVIGSAGPVWDVRVGSNPVVRVQQQQSIRLILSPVQLDWALGFSDSKAGTPSAVPFTGANSYVCNWDDVLIDFTLA